MNSDETAESILNNTPRIRNINSDDSFDSLRENLDRIRKRLLDLTTRNRLLNFRHSKKSALRIIDELHNQLFSKLIKSEELIFKPIPLPREVKLEKDEE